MGRLGAAGRPPVPSADRSDYLSALNAEQRVAVEALDGPVLVLAGAGTGKTRVLTTRLAHILKTGRAWPNQLLAVTFTNKAAREMIERVERLLARSVDGLWLGTFHSMGARILRRHAELVGLKPNFTIIDTDDQLRLLKQILAAANIDEKRCPARVLAAIIDRWKNKGLTVDKVADADGADFADGRAVDLYRGYQERLLTLNAADFGDLLLHNLSLFTENTDLLADYHERFKFILVDEYQDTNVAQYLWLRLLAQGERNICCVGDDDQSIYGWRGAEVTNILRFERDFPGAQVIRLERNYRSTPDILGAASGLIAHNDGRLGKTLWTERQGGEKLSVRGVWDGADEARWVGEEIEALQQKGHALGEIAMLVRAGFQTRAFEERFLEIGLPYRVIGGLRFYERREIRDAVAYIRVLVRSEDGLAFERIVNLPKRGLGNVSIQAIHTLARAKRLSLQDAARLLIETDELKPKARAVLRDLLESFERWRAELESKPHTDVVEIMLDESGYTEMWQKDKSPTAPGHLENLKELVRALEEFETLEGFLDHVSLVMDLAERVDDEMVNLMTLHGAKGLEFDTVFLPGWEEGLFPHQLSLEESGLAGLEEERRLAYVGLTRARRKAYILWAANRHIYNQWVSSAPSRFIDELPSEHIEFEQVGTYDRAGGHAPENALVELERFPELASGLSDRSRSRHRRRRSRMTEAEYEFAEPSADESLWRVGERVYHRKFGHGQIIDVDGDKLAIAFEKGSQKKILASFVEPA
ncbi:MAG: UvrD-helicase domain-containing protein [Proteobacteria bacterium]|nr:UvrD-helicase domain-containing protein [Pseudomonadota bacterium]